jgi:hypothetical protein
VAKAKLSKLHHFLPRRRLLKKQIGFCLTGKLLNSGFIFLQICRVAYGFELIFAYDLDVMTLNNENSIYIRALPRFEPFSQFLGYFS